MKPSSKRLLLVMLSLPPLSGLTACALQSKPIPTAGIVSASSVAPAPAVRPSVCLVWKTVRYSKTDSDDTIRAVMENNAARRAMCGA